MSHSYSRDKLEESRRRKRAQQAAQQQRVSLPSVNSWRGVTPSQLAKTTQQTAPKTTVSRPAVQSSASWKGVTPSQVAKPAVQLPTPKATQTTAVKQPLTFSVGPSLAQRTQQNIKNDNTRRARAARAREGQRQAAQANAAALKKDRAALAANSLKWHQTSDAAVRQRLEAANSAIRARRGYSFDSRTGSTYDSKGNELTLAARQIYGGKLADRVESLRQLPAVSRSKDFVRDARSTAAQPSILEAVRGATSDDPYYAIRSGQKAHSIINSLLNRSDETWTDADTKVRDEARTALQNEMTALFDHYGKQYQPRWNAEQTAAALRNAGADEGTVAYAMENLRLRDSTDRLGQGLEAVGKRLEASVPSLVDTAKQAISNQSENKGNEAFTRLEEQEKQLELQLQNMQSQDENGRVPADYQQVYDQLQRVREEKNALKVTKGVDQNLWSQRMLREANEAQANAEAGLAPAPRWVAEQAISLASNAPTMAASAVPVVGPALGSLVMGAQAAGQRAFELNEQGKSAGEALGRGTVSGIIEAATEKLPLERMAEILHSGGANAVKNILRQMGTEATEEGVSYFLNYVSDLAAADPDAKFSLAELAQSAAGGAFGGLVFGTAGAVTSRGVYGSPTENQLTNRPMTEYEVQADTPYLQVERFTEPLTQTMVKIDEQMRKAEALPEGTIKQQYTAALQEDAQRVSKQLSILENNRAELMQARNIAERFGAKFELADLGPAGGKYENGTITVNPYSSSPVRQVLVHELTHHLENSGAYADLQAAALRAFSEEQGVSADVLRQNITKLYAERGVMLDQDGANRELTAAFCENRLFKDENSIQRLAQTDISLFQRIRQWLSDLVIRLRGTEEQKRVLEVQRLYEKAARTVGAVQDRGAQYTFGREYDNETLAKAVQMEREGADKDTIWNTLGVIRDTKGNWVNEIDDSQMNYDEFGLHQLRKDADFRRLEELEDKANATAENFGYSPEEYAEWEKLTDKYDDAVWDDKYMLRDYLKHDELFKRYPSLRIASLVFEPMRAGERGYYNRSDNSIHINELLKSEPESTLLHEIQHFVQGRDNRPGGANPEYWRLMNESSDEWIDRNLLLSRKQKIIERMNTIEQQVGYSDFYDSLLEREEKGELTSEQVDELDREFIAKYPELEALRNELYNDIYMKLKELGKGKRDPNELYRNTAGEIEARETASRRKMTAEERRQKTPDLGWDRAVFAEDAGTTKNQGQKNKTQTWHQNPDVSRSSSNLDISSVLRNALDGNTSVQNTFGFTPERIAKGTVPLTDAMQYGKTPEQAVMEAKAKREGEQARAQREQTETDLMQSRLADVWSELTELDARGLRHSDEFRDLWDEKNRLNDELAARGEKTGTVLPEIETPQTDSGEHLDPSIFKYPTQAEEMIRAGANAKRTAGDYLDTLKESRNLAAADTNKQLYHDLLDSYEKVRPIDAELEQARKMTQLSQRDQKLLQSALLGGGREVLSKCENQPGAMRLYDLEVQKREAMKPVNEYNSRVRMEREMQADEWADRIAEFATDKKRGLYYITETPERNTYDIFGKNNRADAEEFNETFYKPVHEAVAEATRLQNRLRDRISGLGLDKHESAMVQMIGEGKKAAALEYAEKHGIKLDSAKETKLNHAVDTFRETYNELFDMINRAEVRNGLEPTRKRENYFPHFTEAAPDTLIARAMWRIGMKITGKETLSTDLAGQTENFRPGHKWERHLQHREGDATIYDAVKGFDQYIEDISQYIYLTDSIQNLRALEDAVRYRLSDEGTRAKIDEIKSNYSIDALERRQMMENTYDATDNRTPFQRAVGALEDQKRAGMRNFVVELRRYTDSLAGKKHRGDRGIEDIVGRDVYEISKNIEGRVAANMISLNPGSWLTNFIPLTQAGELSTGNLLQGMMDTIRSTVSDDGFVNASTFLTNRYGSDSISKTTLRKISDAAGAPMEMIDHFVAETIVRARVAQNLKNHVMLDEAFAEADSYAASLMADRSKGATPGAFEMRNPIVKVFTMYQLETNNQLRHFFKDIPRLAQGDFGKAEAVALTKIFAGAYIYNKIYHELTGRDAAFDPIGMIADAFGQLTDDDEDDKKKRALNAATSLGGSIAENLPFIGGVLGGGRVPVSAAIPDVPGLLSEINQGYDSKRLTQDAVKELAKPATYLLLPFGGGAVNRAAQGYMTVKNGGSYRYDKNGEKMLQFPVFGQKPEDWAKAMLFGKSSLTEAQNWKDNGYDSLYAKETEAFDTIREHMRWHKDENGNVVDNSEAAYAAILALRKAEEAAKERHPDNYQDIAATLKRQILMNDKDLSAGQKDFLDRELISGGQSGNYTSQDAFDISQNVRKGRQQAANVALKHGISADTFADLDGYLYALTQEQNDDGTKTYTTNTALGKVLEQIEANGNYTAGEKEAISGYLLITAMSESDKDKYEEEVRGLVNPSDYVRFKSDLAEYQKEFEGTGADHAANVANILNSYTNLTDEQKSVLMNTYNDTAKNDVFHVSEYEKSLTDNSYYKSLNDSEKSKLRAYCNEYEQAISEGRELSGWKAKAYMAKEAGIEPGTYALFQTALSLINSDGGNAKNAEITQAVKLVPGLTDSQKAYLWQAAYGKESTKSNPWGGATVTKYQKGENETVNPVEGGTISSGFGWRQSFQTSGGASSSNHKAIDIAAPQGTPVKAAMSGKIIGMNKYGFGEGKYKGYGVSVTVDCGNGITMEYHHMVDGSNADLNIGDEVKAGQQIGQVGSTGKSTGPHLDFQVVKDGKYVDPRNYIPGYGEGTSETISAAQAAVAAEEEAKKNRKGSGKSGGSSGGTSWSGLKNPKKLKGLPIF